MTPMATPGAFETARRALVVCPDAVVQQGVCRILQGLELFPLVAKSLREAEGLTASRGPFALTIVDAGMTDGDRLESLRRSRLRHEDPGPLGLLAQRDDPTQARKADLLRAEQVVLAPWSLATLQTAIVKVVLARSRPLVSDGAAYDDA